MKTIAVGFMKTGLSSLYTEAQEQGLRCMSKSRPLLMAYKRGDYERVMQVYDQADFFIDWPHPFMYKPFLRKYGADARVVLTVRDEDKWYRSLVRHNQMAHPVTHPHRYMFGRFYPAGFPQEHIEIFRRHNQGVIDYFAEQNLSEQLCVVDVSNPDDYAKFCAFLGLEPRAETFPHENASALNTPHNAYYRFRLHYNKVVQPLYAQFAPRLFPQPGAVLQPLD